MNQSGRMEAIAWLERSRDSKSPSVAQTHATTILAALAKVEEWETERTIHIDSARINLERAEAAEAALARGDELLSQAGRALEAAEAELARVNNEYADWKEAWNKREVACEAAEAEADRLKAALEQIAALPDSHQAAGYYGQAAGIARAALVPADRNTT